jgi:hypothetical protein
MSTDFPIGDAGNEIAASSSSNSDTAFKAKKRKKKDPRAPHRPLSAYNIFFQEKRKEVQAAATEKLSFVTLVARVSGQWKSVTPEDRARFEEEAKNDYTRYNEEMNAYRCRPEVATVLADASVRAGNKRRCKFVGVQKRPLSGYE